jgi:hypothetical protein
MLLCFGRKAIIPYAAMRSPNLAMSTGAAHLLRASGDRNQHSGWEVSHAILTLPMIEPGDNGSDE